MLSPLPVLSVLLPELLFPLPLLSLAPESVPEPVLLSVPVPSLSVSVPLESGPSNIVNILSSSLILNSCVGRSGILLSLFSVSSLLLSPVVPLFSVSPLFDVPESSPLPPSVVYLSETYSNLSGLVNTTKSIPPSVDQPYFFCASVATNGGNGTKCVRGPLAPPEPLPPEPPEFPLPEEPVIPLIILLYHIFIPSELK